MSDQEKTEGCGADTADAFATAIGAITAAEIIERSIAAVGRINIDGPEAVAAAVHALNDMNKAGAVRIRLPDSYTVQRALAADLDGNPYPPGDVDRLIDPEAPATYSVTAVDANGCVTGFAALDLGRPWPPPKVNDEMRRAARDATLCSGYLPHDDDVNEAIYCAMRPLEPKPDAVTYYDISTDTRLPVTQEIFDKTERTMLKAIGARDAALALCDKALDRVRELSVEITSLPRQPDAALERERVSVMEDRDRWRTDCTRVTNLCIERGEKIRYLESVVANMPNAETVKEMLGAKDARIAELKGELAKRPAAFVDPGPAKPPSFLDVLSRGNRASVGLTTGVGDMPGATDA